MVYSIKFKVWLIAALAALLAVVVITVGILGVTRANSALVSLTSGVLTDLEENNHKAQMLQQIQNDILSFAMWRLMNADEAQLARLEQRLTADLRDVEENFRSTVSKEKLDIYLTHVRNAFALVQRNPRLGFMSLTGTASMFDEVKAEHQAHLQASKSLAVQETDRTLKQGRLVILLFVIVAATLGSVMIVSAGMISRSITVSVRSLTKTMGALAADDLAVAIPDTDRRDELGQMARAVEVFKANALARRRIEKDLDDYREHLEELVAARTQEIEQQRMQIEEALSKERELSGLQRQFVSMVSHEFRTPLAIIDGIAQRLLRRMGRQEPERQEQSFRNIRRAVTRLTELMESVLSAARLENGQIKFEPSSCSLVDLVNEVAAGYCELHPERKLTLDLDDLPTEIVADGKLLRQVLSNLMSNAIKYSPDGRYVWITGSTDKDGHAVVTVRDDGLGIPAEEHAQVFERFFRASTSTGIAGSGIGLHLSSHFVRLHGGFIDFESAEGEGTAFSIHLPVFGPGHCSAEPVPLKVAAA